MSLVQRQSLKLSPRFFGPYQVVQRVDKVAYRLNLPPSSSIHPVFHISQLKRKLGQQAIVVPVLPPVDVDGVIKPEPVEVLARRMRKVGN